MPCFPSRRFFLALVIAALASPFSLGSWNFSTKALTPDLTRLNPINGLSRLISWSGLIELVKAIAKALLVGGVAIYVMWSERGDFFAIFGQSVEAGLYSAGELVRFSFLMIVVSMLVIVAIDVPFQLWQLRERVESRHAQQLFDQMRRAIRAGHHLPQSVRAVGGIVAAQRDLCLDFDHGQRRAQFVRGIGSKSPFVFQRPVQPPQQVVDRLDQWPRFERRRMFADFAEVFQRAGGDVAGQLVERPKTAPDRDVDQGDQRRKQHQEGNHRLTGHFKRLAIPLADRLQRLDAIVALVVC